MESVLCLKLVAIYISAEDGMLSRLRHQKFQIPFYLCGLFSSSICVLPKNISLALCGDEMQSEPAVILESLVFSVIFQIF